jgi:Ca-activated chloride channel homolog
MPKRIDRGTRERKSANCILIIVLLVSFCSFIMASYPNNDEEKPQEERNRSVKPKLEEKIREEAAKPPSKGFTIEVDVGLVMMYASVFNKSGKFVGGLKKDNFKLYEDGVEQNISSFSQEDVPITMGILLDLSGSMKDKLDQVKKAALAFLQANNPQDQVFLIGFNDEVELLQDFTSDIDEITDALDNTLALGGTALYDAIYLGIQKSHAGSKAKKAVVVITDGEDRDSYYKLNELISKVQESDVQAFSIGFLNEIPDKGIFGRFSKSIPQKAHDALLQIGEETGGKAFFPDRLTDIHAVVAEIAGELRNQYSISYSSSNAVRDGSFRRVKIELVGTNTTNNHLRYRRGYYAPKGDAPKK